MGGSPALVHGDGTSLWVLTHHEDFARGVVGCFLSRGRLAHPRLVRCGFGTRTVDTAFDALCDRLVALSRAHRALSSRTGVYTRKRRRTARLRVEGYIHISRPPSAPHDCFRSQQCPTTAASKRMAFGRRVHRLFALVVRERLRRTKRSRPRCRRRVERSAAGTCGRTRRLAGHGRLGGRFADERRGRAKRRAEQQRIVGKSRKWWLRGERRRRLRGERRRRFPELRARHMERRGCVRALDRLPAGNLRRRRSNSVERPPLHALS